MLEKSKDILSIREQYAIQDRWLEDRIKNLMPKVLEECGVDLWVVLSSENDEDPVFRTLTPPKMQNMASRLSCLMFSRTEGALNYGRSNYLMENCYTFGYDPRTQDQWQAIYDKINEYKGKVIAVNASNITGQADGLSKHLYDELKKGLDPEVELTENSLVPIRWMETRTEAELAIYPDIYRIAMQIQDEAYSRDVITPGVTTTTDVEYFIMQRINDMGLGIWFSPDVDLQRPGSNPREADIVIQEGDLLHTDMGFTYMGLYTDSQRLGYVLKDGETEVPAGLLAGMKRANEFQDIVRSNMVTGRTGNEIFLQCIEDGKAAGLRPTLYTHPIGVYGHGPGPLFGLYTNQAPIPIRGELKLCDNTCYALELNVLEYVPDWDQDVYFFVEETISFADGKAAFMDPEGRVKIKAI